MSDCLKKGENRIEALIYASPLYINGYTQLKIIILKQGSRNYNHQTNILLILSHQYLNLNIKKYKKLKMRDF